MRAAGASGLAGQTPADAKAHPLLRGVRDRTDYGACFLTFSVQKTEVYARPRGFPASVLLFYLEQIALKIILRSANRRSQDDRDALRQFP